MKKSLQEETRITKKTPANVEEDLGRMSIQSWQVKTQDQQDWRGDSEGDQGPRALGMMVVVVMNL